MATKDDARAALLLVGLALAGAAIRLLGSSGGAPGEIGYQGSAEERPRRDSVAEVAGRLSQPLQAGERIDLDRADAVTLSRLPRIGPALAARIVADREARGPFGSLEEVTRISGVGPTVVEAVRPFTTFSGVARATRSSEKTAIKVSLNTATVADLEQLPGIGAAKAQAIVDDRRRHGRYRSVEDLGRVRGIGAATIERLRNFVTVR
jgi:competence ComEA-like helix-hairpin-helix protein